MGCYTRSEQSQKEQQEPRNSNATAVLVHYRKQNQQKAEKANRVGEGMSFLREEQDSYPFQAEQQKRRRKKTE